MQNDTSNTIDSAKLESEVRDTVAQGDNVQESVQRLTLKALSSEIHDLASLRRVITAVMRGARDGVQQKLQQTTLQTNAAKIQMTDAIAGLDAALA
ncbi:MAG: hypothetical protein ITD34_07110, partial [Nitrosospira sp.]|nr:hypothetical protein [Nitrosospira sp.]